MTLKKNSHKIQKMSAPDLVCNEMKAMISQGIWQEGQRIPSETEMAEYFGVNRFTVRMALQKLNTLGILNTKVGDGTYVCPFNFEQHIQVISEFYMTPALLDDVAEFRSVIEIQCARLAIERATQEEITALKDYCQKFEKSVINYVSTPPTSRHKKQLLSVLNDCDLDIHYQICKMSHNELLIYAYSTAKEAIREYTLTLGHRRLLNQTSTESPATIQAHWDIFDAIRNKDFRRCEQLLTDMIDYHDTECLDSLTMI